MALQTLSVIETPLACEPESLPASLAVTARMEFQAALQLLAERAAFVTGATGVAIAIREGGSFIYRVATGSNVPEPDTAVNEDYDSVPRCFREAKPVRIVTASGLKFLVAVKRNEDPVGFMEVASKYEFSGEDASTTARIAQLASVALDHLAAAENADSQFWQQLQEPLTPKLWHAPESSFEISSDSSITSNTHPSSELHLCSGCGFPVSAGRTLCVECEQKPDAPVVNVELFAAQNHVSWIAEHGYTVASVIVSALATAIIFWLRR